MNETCHSFQTALIVLLRLRKETLRIYTEEEILEELETVIKELPPPVQATKYIRIYILGSRVSIIPGKNSNFEMIDPEICSVNWNSGKNFRSNGNQNLTLKFFQFTECK